MYRRILAILLCIISHSVLCGAMAEGTGGGLRMSGHTLADTISFLTGSSNPALPHALIKPMAGAPLQQIRQYIANAKYTEAQQLWDSQLRLAENVPSTSSSAETANGVGTIYLTFPRSHASVSDYHHLLEDGGAVNVVDYDAGPIYYRREAFCLQDEDAAVVRMTASRKGKLTFNGTFVPANRAQRIFFYNEGGKVRTKRLASGATEFSVKSTTAVIIYVAELQQKPHLSMKWYNNTKERHILQMADHRTGGGWLMDDEEERHEVSQCLHAWQNFLVSADKQYLADIYPIMLKACEVSKARLVTDSWSSYVLPSPSTSPGNDPGLWTYTDNSGHKRPCYVFDGTTLDCQLIYALFNATAQAAKLLGRDADKAQQLRQLSRQLPPMHIGQYGQLQEWLDDWDRESDPGKPIAHLWALYPGSSISPFRTPQLAAAARKSLLGRGLEPIRGYAVWQACLWARLLDGNRAYRILERSESPDNRTARTEMVVQSHDGAVHLLPALPDAWADGSIANIRLNGGFILTEMTWHSGRLLSAKIRSTSGGNLRLRSAVPLKGPSNMRAAKGSNPNPYFAIIEPLDPVTTDRRRIGTTAAPRTYLYDIPTQPGELLTFQP